MPNWSAAHASPIDYTIPPSKVVADPEGGLRMLQPLIRAFAVSGKAFSEGPGLRMPNLYLFLEGARKQSMMDSGPDFTLLGKLVQIAPSDAGYMASFLTPLMHPNLPSTGSDDDAPEVNHLTALCSPDVVDALINSGALLAQDNIVYGKMLEGVLAQAIIYVQPVA